ncbi:MAG TPA: CDP-alcohol phosphatidyltransferase family protein [Bacteroidota bacterium]|nr:CDP-alcohol phosphatidyltransferase family protein [Bacteroidota bacterium]
MKKMPKVESFMNEYKLSLKVLKTEEFFDLVLFRPLAFMLVKGVARTRITPNQITFLSVVVFIVAARMIATAMPGMVLWAGILIAAGNVLDCADGQLTRVKGNGTQYGRILDGIGDYISAIAFFIAIGYWGLSQSVEPMIWWPITGATMVSYGWQSTLVDFHRNEFIGRMNGTSDFVGAELKETRNELIRVRNAGGSVLEKFVLSIYLYFSSVQARIQPGNRLEIGTQKYIRSNARIIRFWCLNGSATSRFLLMVACLLNRIELFVVYVLIVGTIWSISLLGFQMAIDRKLRKGERS